MLSQFPARGLDEPVTKEFVAMTAAELRAEIVDVRREMAEIGNRVATKVQVTVGIVGGLLAAWAYLVR